jgi:hypothetical protein
LINRDRIKKLIYPTLGFPAIIKQGGRLTIEFDPREREWDRALPQLVGFEVVATTTNSTYQATRVLPVKDFTIGFSGHWPEYARDLEPRGWVYLVTVEVDPAVPVHLYDLMVTAALRDGSKLADSQPHALQVVDEFKTAFTVAHMTDIHVWGLEAEYIASNIHERGWRHDEYSEADGYGATYYHKAIQQMNRAKPEFMVFTGDYDFGLKWLHEQDYAEFDAYKDSPWSEKYYETWFEIDWFYEETLKLDIPVFMVPGNHDGWARYDRNGENLEEDYLDSWKRLFGPRYFSFDYGPDYHFTAINSMDWTPAERALHWAMPGTLLGPHRWQGQVTSGGDRFEAGWAEEREADIDEERFSGQLLWVKQDLEEHHSARMKAFLLHHDPWKQNGSGSMFEHMAVIPGLLPWGGRGTGRLALIKLARENNVGLVLSGHDHSDAYGSAKWADGSGEVKFANTTSTQFQDGDLQGRWEYPGYRFVRVRDGEVENCYYEVAVDKNGARLNYSWPFYAGTTVGGPNDLEALTDPAIETACSGPPGAVEELECTITNRLTGCEIASGGRWSGDLENAFIEVPMPNLSGGYYYVVTGGKIVEAFDDDACGHRTYGVTTEVNHAVSEGKASTRTVRISKSDAPDNEAPTCTSFLINGGAEITGEARVTLANEAVDHDGSGLRDMKLWNDDDGEDSAGWQRYAASVGWELRHEPGARTVCVRFRDGAMPGNVSDIYAATITLKGRAPIIDSVEPSTARVGERVVIEGSGFGDGRAGVCSVLFNSIAAEIRSWSDTSVTCEMPLGSCTGEVKIFADTGSACSEFHVTPMIEKVVPDIAFNTGVLHIENLEGWGFSSDGTVPDVRLTNGPVEIPASDIVVVSPQNITCDFDLTGAEAGYYAVVVKNADGCDDMLSGALVVDSPPPVNSCG